MDVCSESGAVFTPEVWRSATARRPRGVDHKLSTVWVIFKCKRYARYGGVVVCEGFPLLPLSEFGDSSELLEEAERSAEKQKESQKLR